MDRNAATLGVTYGTVRSPSSRRAWIEISQVSATVTWKTSPSSRRAWIEMTLILVMAVDYMSPSSRRAWIEIALGTPVSAG